MKTADVPPDGAGIPPTGSRQAPSSVAQAPSLSPHAHFTLPLDLGVLALITAVSALLCFHSLAAKTFWFDEGVSVAIQEARSYTLMLFLCVLSSLYFLKCLENPSRRNRMLYVLVGALAVYAHFFAGLLILTQLLSLHFLDRHLRPVAHGQRLTTTICDQNNSPFRVAEGAFMRTGKTAYFGIISADPS